MIRGKNWIKIAKANPNKANNKRNPPKIKKNSSNRPTKFGEHSGLGLNIAKNIDVVEDEDQAKSIDSAATTTTTEDDEDVNVRIKFVQEVK